MYQGSVCIFSLLSLRFRSPTDPRRPRRNRVRGDGFSPGHIFISGRIGSKEDATVSPPFLIPFRHQQTRVNICRVPHCRGHFQVVLARGCHHRLPSRRLPPSSAWGRGRSATMAEKLGRRSSQGVGRFEVERQVCLVRFSLSLRCY